MPRVSIIIPTYNWSSVLPFSIGSVLDQTFQDFEVLVVGDGCTDDSEAVVRTVKDPRVRWINLERNTGDQAGPCNRGCAEARADRIAYLGHDDLWFPDHLQRLMDTLDHGADMAYSMAACYFEDVVCGLLPAFLEDYRRPMAIAPTTVMHRREWVEKVGGWRGRYEARAAMDYDLWQRFHQAGARMTFVSEVTAVKFPAALRRNVYREKPCDLQRAFLRRIREEPALAGEQKDRVLAWLQDQHHRRIGLYESLLLARNALLAKLQVGRRLGIRPGRRIDRIRRFKGLD